MIQLRDLEVRKQGTVICRVAELTIQPLEKVAIVGRNGSGKTTLLRVLAGLEKSFAGQMRQDAKQSSSVYVHQQPLLFRGTVGSNLQYGLAAATRRGKFRKSDWPRQIEHWLARFGLEALRDRPSGSLSGGERRRVAIARAMILRPALLLLDEPFAELDSEGVSQVSMAIESLHDTTVVLSSPQSVMAMRAELSMPIPIEREFVLDGVMRSEAEPAERLV